MYSSVEDTIEAIPASSAGCPPNGKGDHNDRSKYDQSTWQQHLVRYTCDHLLLLLRLRLAVSTALGNVRRLLFCFIFTVILLALPYMALWWCWRVS